MTQFGQVIQIETKSELPDFVITFFYRVMERLNQKDYHSVMHYKMNEIVARKESLGKDYYTYVVPFISSVMAVVRFNIEKYEDAIKNLNSALMFQEKMLGKKHLLLGATLNNLAVVYAKEGKYERVKMLAERALEIYDPPQSTCHDHPFVAKKLGELARYFNNRGRYKDEKRCYIRALKIYETTQRSDDSFVAAALNELAQCYLRRGKLKEAEECFKNVLSRGCKKEFGGVGDRSPRLNELDRKRTFQFTKDDNQSVTSMWQIAEERERNKAKVSEEDSLPVFYWLASFYTPSFEFALKGLKSIYEKQGKHVAAKILNHYANQQLVASQLPPERISSPSPIPQASANGPHHWSVSQIRIPVLNEVSARSEVPPQLPPRRRDAIQASGIPPPLASPLSDNGPNRRSPPPPLPARGSGPAPIVSREHYPTMRSSPPLPVPSTQELPPAKEAESSCETMTQGLTALPSVPLAEEDKSSIGTEAVPEQTRYLERMVAELQAEIAEKARRLAEAERTIETHGAFCCICKDEVANQMWSGCNHLAACSECAETLRRTEENRSDDGIACPKCRTHGHVLPAFI